MALKLPAGVRVQERPKPKEPERFPGGKVIVPGYGRQTQSSYPSVRAAVEAVREAAVEALRQRDTAERMRRWLAEHPEDKTRENAHKAVDVMAMWEAAETVACRTWAALPEEARVALQAEGWPHADVGWQACREALGRWVEAGQVPHAECPF